MIDIAICLNFMSDMMLYVLVLLYYAEILGDKKKYAQIQSLYFSPVPLWISFSLVNLRYNYCIIGGLLVCLTFLSYLVCCFGAERIQKFSLVEPSSCLRLN